MAQTIKAKRLWYSAGGGNYLRVDRGQYAYVVFSAFGRWGEKDGVMVWKSGAMVAHNECIGRRCRNSARICHPGEGSEKTPRNSYYRDRAACCLGCYAE